MDDAVRFAVYDATMRDGTPPLSSRVAEELSRSREEILKSFLRLAEARMLVLQPSGEILMAGPFSAVPTPFLVTTSTVNGYANCIWDAFGIPAMLHSDAVIDTNCADCGDRARLFITDDKLEGRGFMHFVVPARLWWMHIVYT